MCDPYTRAQKHYLLRSAEEQVAFFKRALKKKWGNRQRIWNWFANVYFLLKGTFKSCGVDETPDLDARHAEIMKHGDQPGIGAKLKYFCRLARFKLALLRELHCFHRDHQHDDLDNSSQADPAQVWN